MGDQNSSFFLLARLLFEHLAIIVLTEVLNLQAFGDAVAQERLELERRNQPLVILILDGSVVRICVYLDSKV